MQRFSTSATIWLALSFICACPAWAQDTQVLGADMGYHPVVVNGRVLWLAGSDSWDLELRLWDGTNTIILDPAARGGFPGWPDLDTSGRAAYMKVIDGSFQLMLWNGVETVQLTNSDIPGSAIDLGRPRADLIGGFPAIAYGNVVFADVAGNVHFYDFAANSIRPITTDPAQHALQTSEEYRPIMQATGIKDVFHYDGRYITWVHQELSGDQSDFIIFQADEEDDFTPRAIASFAGFTPHDMYGMSNSIIAGAVFDPYFTACGPNVAWAYYPPADFAGEAIIGYYDGASAREVTRGDISPLSIRLGSGQLVWIEETEDGDLIRSYRGGGISNIATINPRPAQAGQGETFWSGPGGLEVFGNEVFYFMEQAFCDLMPLPGIGPSCMYPPTFRGGVFSRSSGPESPLIEFELGEIAPGGGFDRGLYVWSASDANLREMATAGWDGSLPQMSIRAISFAGGGVGAEPVGGGTLQITDLLRPDLVTLRPDDPRAKLIDGFSLRALPEGGECAPTGVGDDATVTAVSFDVTTVSGVLADLTDIVALRLHHDVNQNRQLDEGDLLLAQTTAVSALTVMTFAVPMTILSNDEAHFLVEIEMKEADQLCPCNEITVAIAEIDTGGGPTYGGSTGTLALPNALINPVWGDGQAALPTTALRDPLRFRVAELPARCAAGARFQLVTVPGDTATLTHPDRSEGTDLVVELLETEEGLEAEVNLTLGEREGAYYVDASLVYPEGSQCEPPTYAFSALAGTFVLQLVDANDPNFINATPSNGHPDYDSWVVSLTDDVSAFVNGGEVRSGSTADGLSALVLRARVLGLEEAPPGEVVFTMTGAADSGFLTPGLGESIPAVSGSTTISASWTMTSEGPVAVALYTPPRQFDDPSITDRTVVFTAAYQMPGAAEESVEEEQILVYRPPILLTHGMWSNPGAWGDPYVNGDARYETFLADYSGRAAENFDELGGVMGQEIRRVTDNLHQRGIAVTQINVVAHSMGGLITRQYINQNRGSGFRRQDNYGRGDVYMFVTMGTPHYGSPIAWLVMQLREEDSPYYSDNFLSLVNAVGMDIWSGAIDAMCPGSDALQSLGSTHVPAHTIRAWYYDSHVEDLGWGTFVTFVGGLFEDVVVGMLNGGLPTPMVLFSYTIEFGAGLALESGIQGLYGSQKTDFLVTLESQSGGITQGHQFEFAETLHSYAPYVAEGETTSAAIATHVFEVLTESPEDIEVFAPTLPPPIVDVDYVNCESPWNPEN